MIIRLPGTSCRQRMIGKSETNMPCEMEQRDLQHQAFKAAMGGFIFRGQAPCIAFGNPHATAWAHDYGCENARPQGAIFAAIW